MLDLEESRGNSFFKKKKKAKYDSLFLDFSGLIVIQKNLENLEIHLRAYLVSCKSKTLGR